MAQRIHNLSKWRVVEEGQSMSFVGKKQRTVVLDVNCPDPVQFYVIQEREQVEENPERVNDMEAGRNDGILVGSDDDALNPDTFFGGEAERLRKVVWFLGRAVGLDKFEFAVDGPFELVPVGGPAYVFTVDGQDISTKIVAPVIFTRIANRRARNPHLEMIEYQAKLNLQRMQAQMEAEIDRRMKDVEKRYAPQRVTVTPPERVGKAAAGKGADGAENRPSEAADDNAGGSATGEVGQGGGSGEGSGKRKKVAAPSLAE